MGWGEDKRKDHGGTEKERGDTGNHASSRFWLHLDFMPLFIDASPPSFPLLCQHNSLWVCVVNWFAAGLKRQLFRGVLAPLT